MLKKAVLISAVAAAGVVALTPLAFAHESSGHDATTNVQKDNQSVAWDFQNNQATTGAGGCNNADVEDVADLGTDNPNPRSPPPADLDRELRRRRRTDPAQHGSGPGQYRPRPLP